MTLMVGAAAQRIYRCRCCRMTWRSINGQPAYKHPEMPVEFSGCPFCRRDYVEARFEGEEFAQPLLDEAQKREIYEKEQRNWEKQCEHIANW